MKERFCLQLPLQQKEKENNRLEKNFYFDFFICWATLSTLLERINRILELDTSTGTDDSSATDDWRKFYFISLFL